MKRAQSITSRDLKSLHIFPEDYPKAKLYLLYGGMQREYYNNIEVIPFTEALKTLPELL